MPQHPETSFSPELRDDLLKAIPRLRAFAISLTGNVDQADDLVQEAIVRGLSHLDRFTPGTSLQAWLFTILRNHFHSLFRKRYREVEDPDGLVAGTLSTPPEQHGHLDLSDFKVALSKLSLAQREVLLLIGAEGLSYEDAAQICGTKVGTVKSRVNRARARLAELLHVENEDDFGTDQVFKAALSVEVTGPGGAQQAA